MKRELIVTVCCLACGIVSAGDSLSPYTAETVPRNVMDLWKDMDFRKDPLDTKVIKEWRQDGIVCRYVIFTIGTFKGAASRIAAFYTFPTGMKKGPAFVWSHGGGQRADRTHGTYFAKQGYATVDINWGGREMVKGIKPNTDWGKVDPSQGPRFYPGALRRSVKLNLQPDEHTLDPVPSPRNGNWFLLAYAGRRAITFLERQPEVDPERLGFTGYSMGGTITSLVAIDSRLQAVAPMVGGSGYRLDGFPGLPQSARARAFKNADLYNRTIDPRAYWPHVTCPVMFLSASDDFHSTFEKIYRSMSLLPHTNWRVSQNMHYNHSLGPEQWILLNLWFDRYLKGRPGDLPQTAESAMKVNTASGSALFTVTCDRRGTFEALDIYYSHDPNPRTRFWKHAGSTRDGDTWTAALPVREHLPLFAFANCRYRLDKPLDAFQGTATAYILTSAERVHMPRSIKADTLRRGARHIPVFEDFKKHGFRDWGFGPRGGITTYKMQDPDRATPGATHALRVTVTAPRKRLSYRFRILKNRFLTGVRAPQETYSAARGLAEPGSRQIVLKPSDFKNRQGKRMADWTNVVTFTIDVYDGSAKASLRFTDPANRALISTLEWIGGRRSQHASPNKAARSSKSTSAAPVPG